MAYDKIVDSSALDNNLLSIADAIREKAGLEESFAFPAGFVEAIAGIETGGDVQIATGTITFTDAKTGWIEIANLDFEPNFAAISRTEISGASNVLEFAVHFDDMPLCRTAKWLQTTPSVRYYGHDAQGKISDRENNAFYYVFLALYMEAMVYSLSHV